MMFLIVSVIIILNFSSGQTGMNYYTSLITDYNVFLYNFSFIQYSSRRDTVRLTVGKFVRIILVILEMCGLTIQMITVVDG